MLGLHLVEVRRIGKWLLPKASGSRHDNSRDRDMGDANVTSSTLSLTPGRTNVGLL